ncbi:hypothetical protein [Streptomyces sp. RKAG337]|uniref:hypothetical protein n=1 Tax=Streptomyces sp. RKAG337 TaxID=2893404 RepID=UPI002034726F|nr:hypothetical protein [Streptomyces sp. RKAG337]MCM2425003.1 hypothetical protein [Streptomyces sp. RKAG337]
MNQIVMPGSHDAGTWSITKNSGVCSYGDQASLARKFPSIATSISKSQSGNLVQQLDGGSRYLDLRLCKQGDKWFTYHGGPMGSLQFFDTQGPNGIVKGEVDQLADWVDRHPQEIVIIRLSTAVSPATAAADNHEAVAQLGDALGGGAIGNPAIADGSLSPTSTYDQYVDAGKHVVLMDTTDSSTYPWAWDPAAMTYRGSYVQADTAWTDFVKALFDPKLLDKTFDAVLKRSDRVLDKAPGADAGKFFVLQDIIDPTLSIPDLVFIQALGTTAQSSAYLLFLEDQLNARVLARMQGDWSYSGIAENMNIVMTDDVNQNDSRVHAGELQRAIIALNAPRPTPHMFYNAARNADGSWTAETPLSGVGDAFRFAGARESVAAMPDGGVQLIGTGLDGNIYHNIHRADGTWQGWVGMGGVGKPNFGSPDAAITGMPNGEAQTVAVGLDGNVYHNIRRTDGSWQGWRVLAGDGGTGQLKAIRVAAAGMPDGSTQVLVFGKDGRMRLSTRAASGSWTDWSIVQGVNAPDFSGSALTIAALPNGDSQIAAIGNDGNVWHTIHRADGAWQGWGAPRGVTTPTMGARSIALTGMPNGDSQLLAVGLDGNVYHTIRGASGDWTAFQPVSGLKGAGTFPGDQVGIAGLPNGSSQVVLTTR